MELVTRLAGWLTRRALLFVALVAALLIAPYANQWRKAGFPLRPAGAEAQYADLSAITTTLRAQADGLKGAQAQRLAALAGQSAAALDARMAEIDSRLAQLNHAISAAPPAQLLVLRGKDAVLANARLSLERAALMRERQALILTRQLVASRDADLNLAAQRRNAARAFVDAQAACLKAESELADFTRPLTGQVRRVLGTPAYDRFDTARRQACADRDSRRQLWQTAARLDDAAAAVRARAQTALDHSDEDLALALDAVVAPHAAAAQAAWVRWQGTFGERARQFARAHNLDGAIRTAIVLFVLILIAPYLIRLLFYFVLAPMAERRGAIRLNVPGGRGPPLPAAPRSATSVNAILEPEEELVVRQDYLQTSALAGTKTTRWLLDWRHPISSLVTGLWFLTAVRGPGHAATVSAVRDPLAEVAPMTLPLGSACVLQPRALAAVVQPIGQPMRITTHWRLFSLNAWLTLQLRYFVFHGPGQLVIKGRRGVRVEAAAGGRVFGQAQLVGFSADLAYSVTRTETFWPYFLGREQLLKDKVEQGAGVLIVEEAPLAGGRAGGTRHGLEGALDVALKAVGL